MDHRTDRRWLWVGLGLAAGVAATTIWPHEYAAASVADRNDKFAMVTAQIDQTDFVEGVFVLDFLTGQLRGATVNPASGNFAAAFTRNVAADFQVDPNRPGVYAIVSGRANPTNAPRVQRAASFIYVAENTSGTVIAYSLVQPTGRAAAAPVPLQPVDRFQFREAVPK